MSKAEKQLDKRYSVLMTVYKNDNPEWFTFAIESILNQTIKPDEFVIVQDGPVPETIEKIIDKYVKDYDKLFVIYKFKENQTLGPALHKGVELCKNNFIARMDSDDYCIPTRIEEEFKIFESDPELSLVGSNVIEFEGTPENHISNVILPETQDEIYNFSKKRCPFRHPSLLYKKDAVLKAGNYRKYYLCEDYDLYNRMLRTGSKCYNIQKPLTYMRVDKNFYKRRGGIKYLKSILKFKKEQLHVGYLTRWQYIRTATPHIIVCLMPNFLRDFVYRKMLRK